MSDRHPDCQTRRAHGAHHLAGPGGTKPGSHCGGMDALTEARLAGVEPHAYVPSQPHTAPEDQYDCCRFGKAHPIHESEATS